MLNVYDPQVLLLGQHFHPMVGNGTPQLVHLTRHRAIQLNLDRMIINNFQNVLLELALLNFKKQGHKLKIRHFFNIKLIKYSLETLTQYIVKCPLQGSETVSKINIINKTSDVAT